MAPNINAMDQDTQSGNPDIQPVVPGNINQVVSMLNKNREARKKLNILYMLDMNMYDSLNYHIKNI